MSTTLFDDIHFIRWDHCPVYAHEHRTMRKKGEGHDYITLEVSCGKLQYQYGNGDLEDFDGIRAWIVVPEVSFHYRSPPDIPRDHRFVAFFGPKVESYYEHGLIPRKGFVSPLEVAHPARLIEDFDTLSYILGKKLRYNNLKDSGIVPEHEMGQPIKNQGRCVLLLESLLLQLHDTPQQISSPHFTPELLELVERISAKPEVDRSIPSMAREIGLSVPHFRRLFKNATGFSPQQFVIQQRIDRACSLLRTTDVPIKAISMDAGFMDFSYFSRQFKQHCNTTPAAFRRASRNL